MIMKKKIKLALTIFLIITLLIPNLLFGQKKRISVSGAFALYAMAVKWAEEYKKIHPEVRIDISAGGAGKGITDVLNEMVDIGMVSRDIYPEEIKKGAIPVAVTRDAVVAVVSSLNPALNDIMASGITSETAGNIWISGKYKTWNQAFNTKIKAPIHVYTRSDACGAAEIWAHFFSSKQEDLLGSAVFGDPGLALAIRKDVIGLGFNNICYAYDFVTRKQFKGIRVVPIDVNKNGKIDPEENFYDSLDQLTDAIADNKYPSPPSRDLFFVISNKQKNKAAGEFLKWVLTDGQKYVKETGYIVLSKEKVTEELKKIN